MTRTDRKMLKFIEILKALQAIRFDTHFCNTVGVKKQNLYNIRQGKAHFTPEHIERAVTDFDLNANWLFGVSDKIFNNEKFRTEDFEDTATYTRSHTETTNNVE